MLFHWHDNGQTHGRAQVLTTSVTRRNSLRDSAHSIRIAVSPLRRAIKSSKTGVKKRLRPGAYIPVWNALAGTVVQIAN